MAQLRRAAIVSVGMMSWYTRFRVTPGAVITRLCLSAGSR